MKLPNSKLTIILSFIVVINLLMVASFFYIFNYYKQSENQSREKITTLENTISSLQENYQTAMKELGNLTDVTAKLEGKPVQVIQQEIVRGKSQNEQLIEAVSKITPAVVSIIISKDVPNYEVVYSNPFGDDPFFKDFNIRVPSYRVKGTQKQKVGAGTGFIINGNGYIVTNNHVVADSEANYTVLLSDGTQKPAAVIYRDRKFDLALVKIDGGNYKYAPLGSSDNLKLGQSVFAVGNALGEYNNSVSVGIISGLNRNIQASGNQSTEELKGVIQTDAAINPGNSGGPLVSLDGEVVGVNVATVVGSNNISFSIPVNTLKSIVASVVK